MHLRLCSKIRLSSIRSEDVHYLKLTHKPFFPASGDSIDRAVVSSSIRDILYSSKEPPVEHIEGSQEIRSIFLEESIRLDEELGVDLSH